MDWTADPTYGRLHMEVNGVAVVGTSCMTKCCALKHEHDDPEQRLIWQPNQDRQYTVRASIQEGERGTYSYVRISSFVLL